MTYISTKIAGGGVVNYVYRGDSKIGWCSYMCSRSARSTCI